MDEALRFFRTYEVWIYMILAFGALINFRRFVLSWQELRSTIFGLEREKSQAQLNQAAGVLVLLVVIAVAEFVTVSFVVPMRPQADPLSTPTIDLLATATFTLPPRDTNVMLEEDGPTLTPSPTLDLRQGACVIGEVEITSPQPGERVSGELQILGAADVPNFGFYKLEIAPIQSVNWRTIQAGRTAKNNAVVAGKVNNVLVENWDTATLQAGDYVLRLVVTLNDETILPDCRVPFTILPPQE